jgi:hypothetical protein
VTSFGSAEKRAESERWIEITPPSRAVALALTGSGIATEETPSAAQAPSIQGDLQEIGMFLNCEDFQRTYRALSERGVKFLAPPAKMPLGLFSIFEDIEGRRYLLGQW